MNKPISIFSLCLVVSWALPSVEPAEPADSSPVPFIRVLWELGRDPPFYTFGSFHEIDYDYDQFIGSGDAAVRSLEIGARSDSPILAANSLKCLKEIEGGLRLQLAAQRETEFHLRLAELDKERFRYGKDEPEFNEIMMQRARLRLALRILDTLSP